MNIDELKQYIQPIFDLGDNVGVNLYAQLKGDDGVSKLDISQDSIDGLKVIFFQSLTEKIFENDELSLLSLSESDERMNALYIYDIEIPGELECLSEVVEDDEIPVMDLSDDELKRIKNLIIEIGNNDFQIVLYKTMSPVNVFARSSLFLKKSGTRLDKIDDEFLRVSPSFQLLSVNGELLVMDLSVLEKSFGFHQIIKKEATIGLDAVAATELVENMDVLHDLIDDVKYARKFTKVAKSSPVLKANVPNEKIIEFCKCFPKLAGKIRFNDDGSKILLDTKVSKNLFIKLLMDDYLTSELTEFHYDSVAKDSADEMPDMAGD